MSCSFVIKFKYKLLFLFIVDEKDRLGYVERRGRISFFKSADLENINRRINNGESYASIARDYGVHINNFYYWQGKGLIEKRFRKVRDETIAVAKRMRKNGSTYREIAEELGVDLRTIFRLKKQGKLL